MDIRDAILKYNRKKINESYQNTEHEALKKRGWEKEQTMHHAIFTHKNHPGLELIHNQYNNTWSSRKNGEEIPHYTNLHKLESYQNGKFINESDSKTIQQDTVKIKNADDPDFPMKTLSKDRKDEMDEDTKHDDDCECNECTMNEGIEYHLKKIDKNQDRILFKHPKKSEVRAGFDELVAAHKERTGSNHHPYYITKMKNGKEINEDVHKSQYHLKKIIPETGGKTSTLYSHHDKKMVKAKFENQVNLFRKNNPEYVKQHGLEHPFYIDQE